MLLKDNAMLILIVVMFFIKTYFTVLSPIKDIEGSLVQTVKDVDDWNAKVAKALGEEKVVVVDFFAHWCGPCKTSAPVYAQLSREYERSPVTFWKVDVDAVSAVSTDQNIRAMPTFRVYTKGEGGKLLQAESIEGWNEAKLRAAIQKHCTEVDKKGK